MYRHKATKTELLAAPVTKDFLDRVDRAIAATPGFETRSTLLRYLTEQWVEGRESEMQQTDGRVTAQ
jgi:metal-responsive CopG/Arc/MetJ family transcriptional regulator